MKSPSYAVVESLRVLALCRCVRDEPPNVTDEPGPNSREHRLTRRTLGLRDQLVEAVWKSQQRFRQPTELVGVVGGEIQGWATGGRTALSTDIQAVGSSRAVRGGLKKLDASSRNL